MGLSRSNVWGRRGREVERSERRKRRAMVRKDGDGIEGDFGTVLNPHR